MIKLKNLWKIALATMAMSTMLVACDTAKEDDDKGSKDDVVDTTVYVEYPTEAKVSDNGVYTAKLVKEGADLTGGFGSVAGEKESIKVVLAPKEVVAKIIDGTITNEGGLFTDDNKCYVYANNDVGNALFTSATVTEGTYVQPAAFEEYEGLAITKDADGNYIVKFDITKIKTSLLLAKGEAETKVTDEEDPWNAVDSLKTNYIPMVVGSVTGNSGAAYPLKFWYVGAAIMEPTTENYPTNIKKEAKLAFTLANVKCIAGTVSTWDPPHPEMTDGKTYTFKAAEKGDARFKFTVGTWAFQAGSVDADTTGNANDPAHNYTAADMGKEIEIKGSNNATAFIFPVEKDKEYTITLDVTQKFMKFEEKK